MMKKRLISSILALTMVASMGFTSTSIVSRAQEVTATNFTTNSTTAYTTLLTGPAYTATLGVGPANAQYAFVGYSSADDAKDSTVADWVGGTPSFATITGESAAKDGSAGYAATYTVEGTAGAHGAASLLTYNKLNPSAYLNLTVYQEASDTVADATEVYVEVTDKSDLAGAPKMNYVGTKTVTAADKNTTENPFKGKTQCAQSYPTAGDALYSMVGTGRQNITSFTQSNGYVGSVTKGTTTLAEYSAGGYYGWNYCVIRGAKGENGKTVYSKVPGCDVISASVFEVKSGDRVYWVYGTSDQANSYFTSVLDDLNK